MALSDRMKHVLMLVTNHKAIADIGCDHGYMAIELIWSGKAEHVIAVDINQGPLERAKENVDAHGLSKAIETRISDGMEALCQGEVQGVICAGMGGKTICGIIGRRRMFSQTLDELVLQPQSELHIVRRYLRENGFRIIAEDMVLEDGKFYPMMRVNPIGDGADAKAFCHVGQAVQMQRVEDRYGPCLIAGAHPVLQQFLQKEKAVCEEILQSLSAQDSKKSLARREELAQRLSDIAFAERQMEQNRTE